MTDQIPTVCFSLLLLTCAGHAQQAPTDTRSIRKDPVDAPPAATQFVAVAREGAPALALQPDMQVTLWDIPKGQPAVRRVTLGNSPWKATPLLDSPTLLRWQVPNAVQAIGPQYDVKLLGIDFTDFTVTELLTVRQAQALGQADNKVYLKTSEGQSILDLSTGKIVKLDPELKVLAKHGDGWLVEVDGVVARFDAKRSEVVRRYPTFESHPHSDTFRYVNWDGGRFAVAACGFVDDAGTAVHALNFGKPSIVYQELRIWDLDTGAESIVRARTQAIGGSGVGVIPMQMHTELVGGMFRYTERRPAIGAHEDLGDFDWRRDAEWVTIDVANGKELLRTPYRPRDLKKPDPMEECRVPVYLRAKWQGSRTPVRPSTVDIARALLSHKNIELVRAADANRQTDPACRTADGEQILMLRGDTFYHCNLKTQAVTKWAAPAALKSVSVDLHVVSRR